MLAAGLAGRISGMIRERFALSEIFYFTAASYKIIIVNILVIITLFVFIFVSICLCT